MTFKVYEYVNQISENVLLIKITVVINTSSHVLENYSIL